MVDGDIVLVNLPMRDGDQVEINIQEIAAMREHTVTSYTYEKWTEITLKNGEKFDCRIELKTVRERIEKVMEAML